MPRKPSTAPATAAKKPAALKRAASAGAKRTTTRQRRSPYELVQELRTKRDELERTYQAKLQKLDDRIALLEKKHGERIKISQLLETKTPEELQKELEEIKRQQSLLRKAMKRSSNA